MSTATRSDERSLEPKRLRRVFVGRPMPSGEMEETLLPKWLALPIFASDPLSSVAYATEAALVVLVGVVGGRGAPHPPDLVAIAAVLGDRRPLVPADRPRLRDERRRLRRRQARTSGRLPSLVAAAALLTDYVLTVAVSVAAGVLALTSAAPSLAPHEVGLSLALVADHVVNLRGVRESGVAFALPTYGFIAAMFVLDRVGLVEVRRRHLPQARRARIRSRPGRGAMTLFVLLRAFASGSSALTGVEAIANGVSAFRRPQGATPRRRSLVLGGDRDHALPRRLLPRGADAREAEQRPSRSSRRSRARSSGPARSAAFMYYLVQGLTFAILVLAANTSFQGFPRLAALLARDRFFPRQFVNLGDRLVYSNGMFVLAGAAAALLVIFKANVNCLIHLYVVGVFTAFTLSQAGMVRYWRRDADAGLARRALDQQPRRGRRPGSSP